MTGWQYIEDQGSRRLAALAATGRLRNLLTGPAPLDVADNGIDLTHNDYLALRTDRDFRSLVRAMGAEIEFGSGASRLLGGNHPIFSQLERTFSDFKTAEASLYFSSGFLANVGLLTSLAHLGGRFFSDQLNHASIIDGLRLAGVSREDRVVYAHRDLDDLERKLIDSDRPVNFIVTESVFSMDGDVADLNRLSRLADKYRGVLVVDEAHAVGCFGRSGNGMISEQGLSHQQMISVNACGKAMGAQGAFVSGPEWLRDYLINHARSFIYSTAPSPFIAGVLLAAISFVSRSDDRRAYLASLSQMLRHHLTNRGINCGESTTHILPIIVGGDAESVLVSHRLAAAGVIARAIRPPTVPEGQCRVRISLHAGLTRPDVESVAHAIVQAVHP